MAQRNFSAHQQKIISNYYQHLDTILLGRLQELVSQLFLAQTDSQRQKLWKRVEKSLLKLNIPDAIRLHLLQQKNVEVLAKNLEEWLRQS